ncbi:MAG: hypothetical protein D6756_02925 [Cyanobacteria bacterium J083]|nr:MAG: hypothetical protein D6756_02925 [Cyanobacteria bacterium J083]
MLSRFLTIILCLSFFWTTVACNSNSPSVESSRSPNSQNTSTRPNNQISQGKYPVQQVSYDDATGEYTIMLLNTPPGTSPIYVTTDLRMARLTDEEIQKGEKTYLEIDNSGAVLHLTEDFRIEYNHTVTETQVNPQTGQPETVIVRRESSFWAPFAGALAGEVVGNLLFRPRYYIPPVYQPGRVLVGYGSYGDTYEGAVRNYQARYKTKPPVVRNRNFRSTGTIRSKTNQPQTPLRTRRTVNSNKSTGSGVGSSNLGSSSKRRSSTRVYKRKPSFGSSSRRRPIRTRGFGSSRRRR